MRATLILFANIMTMPFISEVSRSAPNVLNPKYFELSKFKRQETRRGVASRLHHDSPLCPDVPIPYSFFLAFLAYVVNLRIT